MSILYDLRTATATVAGLTEEQLRGLGRARRLRHGDSLRKTGGAAWTSIESVSTLSSLLVGASPTDGKTSDRAALLSRFAVVVEELGFHAKRAAHDDVDAFTVTDDEGLAVQCAFTENALWVSYFVTRLKPIQLDDARLLERILRACNQLRGCTISIDRDGDLTMFSARSLRDLDDSEMSASIRSVYNGLSVLAEHVAHLL